ncbi:small-conductance mechanosensitive channel [Agrobacterium vitis]|nr:small-conductance mechanosensitive channel [Agrobacterium vitis]MBE1437830.1 small-conductance mechanosensitive channel [Agrobacterium vitis]
MSGAFASTAIAADDTVTIHIGPNQSSSDIEKALDAAKRLGKPVVVEWSAVPTTPSQPDSSAMQSDMMMSAYSDVLETLVRGGDIALTGLHGLPTAFHNSWIALSKEDAGMQYVGYTVIIAILAGLSAASAFLFVFTRFLPKLKSDRAPLAKASIAALRLIGDLCALVIFVAIARSSIHLALASGSFAREVAGGLLQTVSMTATFATAGRLLFAHNGPSGPLLDIANPRWHLGMTIGFGALSGIIAASLRIADTRGLDPMAIDGWLFLSSTIVTIYKLIWLIVGRKDIALAFSGRDANGLARAAGAATVYFYALSALFIWLLGFLVTGTAQNATWSRVAGTSQVLFVLMPILGRGLSAFFRVLGTRRAALSGPGFHSVLLWALRIPFAGACWVFGIQFTIILWRPLLEGAGIPTTTWLAHLQQFGIAAVCSWFVCSFLWKYFDAVSPDNSVKLPGHDDDAAHKTASRLSTVLPVMRNLVLSAVVSIAVLVTLSSLDVDVAPLLAGFGVLGLALSFGSQTLVKDVVSGVFFLAEDAFRIGEYIDTGKLKGTVEQISLRSIRLRHQNGPIHTIPFGQIAAVTNFSRDWGTVKFELRFDRDAELETIRRTAKKVGLSMLEDPEFGHEFLVPLKMQGIQEVNENSMVIRFKFTSRPGNPSIIKREGIKRLLSAFKAAGLNLASNAVFVHNGSGTLADGAAAIPPITAANLP